jgi:S-adenosylmethionine:tRNA ribosyltransferase-isomerase
VLPARFEATRQSTGGRAEGLFLETRDDRVWHLMLKAGGKLRAGETIGLTEEDALELRQQEPDGSWIADKRSALDTESLLDRIGSMPLPPYIRRSGERGEASDALDRQRYQTVFAERPGAVAAPTAGLHFTDALLKELEKAGVGVARLTLHVGLGTFAPVRADRLDAHPMHRERFTVPAETLQMLAEARRAGHRIIPVGTTCVRALESLPQGVSTAEDYAGETDLLIQPGFRFRYTDGLMTNFHLPRSTLLALVAAITGLDRLKRLYRLAVEEEYRFYSYGDAMLILPD